MRLKIITPLSIVVDETIESLRAEDASGSFGILPSHTPLVTALAISIISWRQAKIERFCAVRGGVLTVSGRKSTVIAVTTREAVVGDDLATLDVEVLARFQSDADAERVDHIEAVQLQLNAIRRMVNRLHTGANKREFR